MSKLFFSDSGRVVHLQHEELTRSRHARKQFHFPETVTGDAKLYILAKSRSDCDLPLHIKINGYDFSIPPRDPFDHYLTWFTLDLQAKHVKPETNRVELWSESPAMDSWMLGIEGRASNPDSALSFDGGATWQNERMSIRHNLRGEYVLRLRLNDPSLSDSPPPSFMWEAADYPRRADILSLIPRDIQAMEEPWQQVLALSAWVSCQWQCNDADDMGQTTEYCPWDAMTILAWRKSGTGQHLTNPIAFCVHHAIVFISAATALGIKARAVCGSQSVVENRLGHFIGEVWIDKWNKWCHVDPTSDMAFVRNGIPLSTAEVSARAGKELRDLVQVGKGLANRAPEKSRSHINTFGSGEAFIQWAVWPRNDFLSRPDLTPPAHGANSYSETDWLWARQPDPGDLGMFPFKVSADELADAD